MQARQLPLNRGWAWFKEGLLLWCRNPGLATFATFFCLLIPLMLAAIPFAGGVIASVLTPIFTVGILNAFRYIDEDIKERPDLLLFGIRRNLSLLVTVGCVYMAASVAIVLLTALVDNGAWQRLLESATKDEPSNVTPGEALYSLSVTMILSLPVVLAYVFAPVLTGWWSVPPFKAMFFSFIASLRNWRAFLAYGIVMLLVMMSSAMVLALLSAAMPSFAGVLALIFFGMLIPVCFASYYIIARDIFPLPPIAVGAEGDDRV